jgi:formate dehydrogenase accessory protein FdhD
VVSVGDQANTANVWQWTQYKGLVETSDVMAEEVPVALVVNGISHAVMMATPLNLHDFAHGFCWTEGIISRWDHLYSIEERCVPGGIELDIHIHAADADHLQRKRRFLHGRTGCGLCGKESLDEVVSELPIVSRNLEVGHKQIQVMITLLAQHQTLNTESGGLHAAALLSTQGALVCLREDVGRHNALDKVIGAVSPSQCPETVLVMTSRMSYELVEKAAKAGIEVIVALSAVTQLARDRAQQSGITLIGFARTGRHTIYTHPDRVQ